MTGFSFITNRMRAAFRLGLAVLLLPLAPLADCCCRAVAGEGTTEAGCCQTTETAGCCCSPTAEAPSCCTAPLLISRNLLHSGDANRADSNCGDKNSCENCRCGDLEPVRQPLDRPAPPREPQGDFAFPVSADLPPSALESLLGSRDRARLSAAVLTAPQRCSLLCRFLC